MMRVPKHCCRVFHSSVGRAVEEGIQAICGYAGCEVTDINVQGDHVHLTVLIAMRLVFFCGQKN